MAKEELIQFEGLVTEILPDARYRGKIAARRVAAMPRRQLRNTLPNTGARDPGHAPTMPGPMKGHRAQKALAVPAAVVVIMPRRSRTGTNSRVRRSRPARAKAGKVKAFRASPSCIARAVRILNPTVPTDRSAKPRSTWRPPWLKKS